MDDGKAGPAAGGVGPDEKQPGKYRAGLSLTVTDPRTGEVLPGRYHMVFSGIVVDVPGPWQFQWTLQ
jgi:hypothetical protein